MTTIRYLTSRFAAGRRDTTGDIKAVTDDEAKELVRIGHAEIIETAALSPQVETRNRGRKSK